MKNIDERLTELMKDKNFDGDVYDWFSYYIENIVPNLPSNYQEFLKVELINAYLSSETCKTFKAVQTENATTVVFHGNKGLKAKIWTENEGVSVVAEIIDKYIKDSAKGSKLGDNKKADIKEQA